MDTNYDPNILFYEEQQFRQPWLMAVLIGGFALFLVAAFIAFVSISKSHPSNALANPAVYVLASEALTMGLVTVLLLSVKMITEVRWDRLVIRAYPITRLRREIAFEQITSCEARTYSPIREYGGWGIRYGRGGKAYNISGHRGVQMVLESGERLLVGSQKADELAAAILDRMKK